MSGRINCRAAAYLNLPLELTRLRRRISWQAPVRAAQRLVVMQHWAIYIEDEIHSEQDGPFQSFEAAIAELRRRAVDCLGFAAQSSTLHVLADLWSRVSRLGI